jgi:RND family efflux transporter MFP subunit
MTSRPLLVAIALPLIVISINPHLAFAQADGSASVEQTFKGIVAPARSFDIPPPADGQIVKIHFEPGQFVDKGALLFTLDSTKEDLELERDQARLLRAEAQLRIADQALKANAEQRKKNAASDRQYVEAEAQRDIAAATAAEARVHVKADEISINELKRYAPFAGIMSPPTVPEGVNLSRMARENGALATITSLDPIQVKTSIPYEVYADHLKF